jgi:hypothetical protein
LEQASTEVIGRERIDQVAPNLPPSPTATSPTTAYPAPTSTPPIFIRKIVVLPTVKIKIMDVRAEKLWLIEQIASITDERLISTLKSLLEFASQKPKAVAETDFWDELTEAQKRRIELSIKQLDEGEGIPHEAVMAEFRTKLRKAK